MAKALEMGRNSAFGSLQLFIGKLISTVALAVGTIILGIFILESDYGLYTIALIPATTILLFQDWGISAALIKTCAQCRARNQTEELRKIIIAGFTFEVITGSILTVFSLLMAGFIASAIFAEPGSVFLITLASITILSTSLFVTSQSIFIGFERMGLYSLILIFQAVTQGVVAPLLVYLGYGALGAMMGYTLAILISSILAVGVVYFGVFRDLPHNTHSFSILQTLKPLLSYGIPLAVGSIITGILPQFYSFLMAVFVDMATIGNFRIATNFAVLLTFLTIPISTVLFPAFSKLDPQKERKLLKTVFTSSVKYTAILLVPATIVIVVMSQPIIGTIYGTKWPSAALFLSLYVLTNLFAVFGNLSLNSLLSGIGETKMVMKLNILTLFIGVPMAFLLIPYFEIVGMITVLIVATVPSMFIGLYWAWKHYGTKADFRSSLGIFVASIIAAVPTYVAINVLNTASWIMLATGTMLFLAIYLIAAPLIGAINQSDINNLRAMVSGLGFISKTLEIPLVIIQKVLNVRNGDKLSSTINQSTPS